MKQIMMSHLITVVFNPFYWRDILNLSSCSAHSLTTVNLFPRIIGLHLKIDPFEVCLMQSKKIKWGDIFFSNKNCPLFFMPEFRSDRMHFKPRFFTPCIYKVLRILCQTDNYQIDLNMFM